MSSLFLAKLAKEAGVPECVSYECLSIHAEDVAYSGVLSVLSGAGPTGELLASHMRIRKIAFTGSTRTGRLVSQAAARSNLKNVKLEFGG